MTADLDQLATRLRSGLTWQKYESDPKEDDEGKSHAHCGLAVAGHRDRLVLKIPQLKAVRCLHLEDWIINFPGLPKIGQTLLISRRVVEPTNSTIG
jgi:hypothetical protein